MKLLRPYMFEGRASKLMGRAMELAEKSDGAKVGAVLAGPEGEVISEGFNDRSSPFLHAESIALRRAEERLKSPVFMECTLFCTLEPCAMCAGAIVNARIDRVVYGASDIRFGACGSLFNINSYPLNHAFEITSGVCEEECKKMLSDFFAELRKKK